MNAQELEIHDALHEAMGELPVTDHDVARLESEMITLLEAQSRRESSRGRWRLAIAAVVAAAVVVVGVVVSGDARVPARPAGPPASDRPLVPADIVGTWRAVPDSRHVWVFVADGRVSVDPTPDDFLEADFKDRVVSRSGDLYTVHTEDGCDETVRIRTLRPGAVGVAGQRTSCDPGLGPDSTEILLERVSPVPYLGGELAAPVPTAVPGFSPQSTFIDGVWLHPGTGTVLAIGRPWGDGLLRYVLDDDGDGKTEPDQRGRVTMRDGGTPVFRRDAAEATGCVLAFTSLVVVHESMKTTSAGGGCEPAGQRIWVRVS